MRALKNVNCQDKKRGRDGCGCRSLSPASKRRELLPLDDSDDEGDAAPVLAPAAPAVASVLPEPAPAATPELAPVLAPAAPAVASVLPVRALVRALAVPPALAPTPALPVLPEPALAVDGKPDTVRRGDKALLTCTLRLSPELRLHLQRVGKANPKVEPWAVLHHFVSVAVLLSTGEQSEQFTPDGTPEGSYTIPKPLWFVEQDVNYMDDAGVRLYVDRASLPLSSSFGNHRMRLVAAMLYPDPRRGTQKLADVCWSAAFEVCADAGPDAGPDPDAGLRARLRDMTHPDIEAEKFGIVVRRWGINALMRSMRLKDGGGARFAAAREPAPAPARAPAPAPAALRAPAPAPVPAAAKPPLFARHAPPPVPVPWSCRRRLPVTVPVSASV
jgi:hypothetical protein